jgi:hypothetical protein
MVEFVIKLVDPVYTQKIESAWYFSLILQHDYSGICSGKLLEPPVKITPSA